MPLREPDFSVVHEGGGRLDVDNHVRLGRVAVTVENVTTAVTITLTPSEARRLGRYLVNASSQHQPSDV